MDTVHKGCPLGVVIGPMGGEPFYWVRANVVVQFGKGFSKGPGLVFGLRRALTFALPAEEPSCVVPYGTSRVSS